MVGTVLTHIGTAAFVSAIAALGLLTVWSAPRSGTAHEAIPAENGRLPRPFVITVDSVALRRIVYVVATDEDALILRDAPHLVTGAGGVVPDIVVVEVGTVPTVWDTFRCVEGSVCLTQAAEIVDLRAV